MARLELPKGTYTEITVQCAMPDCTPTLRIPIEFGDPEEGPGNTMTVSVQPVPGAIKQAIKDHLTEAHPDVEVDEGAFGDDGETE